MVIIIITAVIVAVIAAGIVAAVVGIRDYKRTRKSIECYITTHCGISPDYTPRMILSHKRKRLVDVVTYPIKHYGRGTKK